ncbi:MAG: GNAT family N-acetyltransferase [Anaerolineae bacterium]|jgi:GNAT superfamily N-acetyltransferase
MNTLELAIRPFDASDADYAARVAIGNELFPDYVETVEEMKHDDAHRDPKLHHERWMAVTPSGEVVGIATAGHSSWSFHPRKLFVDVSVRKGWHGRGIGTRLYDHLMASIERFEPGKLSAGVREDYAASRRFVEKRGFVEQMREWENHLDVASYDPSAFAGKPEAVEASGLRIATLSTLMAEDPDGWGRRLFDCSNAAAADIPSADAHTDPDFETWYKRFIGSPNLLPDGYMVALDGPEYVGISTLWASQGEPNVAYTGITGVRREYRRRGIALALKLRALDWAVANGYVKVKTWNNTGNQGMLSINYALGFKPQPAWIDYALVLDPALAEATAWENNGTFVDPETIAVPVG